MIEYWFPTPIFVHDFSGDKLLAIQKEITQAIPSIRNDCNTYTQGGTVLTTYGFDKVLTDDIETYKLTALKEAAHDSAIEYARELKYEGDPFTLSGAWTSFYSKGGIHFDHSHPHSRISGVYYYATNEQDGNIRFQNPNPHLHFAGFPADSVNLTSVKYTPKVGRLILFPSWLVHRVEMNTTDNERISLAFNFV